MSSAASRGWGPGWPRCDRDEVVTLLTPSGLRLPVQQAIALPTLVLVQRLEDARGRPFEPTWSWGFACRPIAGTSTPSTHSWALSIDLDAPENPHADAAVHRAPHPLRKTFPGGRVLRSTMPQDVEAIAFGLGYRWGGTFAKPDPMHLEYVGTPADARRLTSELAAALRALATAGAAPTSPPTLRPGSSGAAVRFAQDMMKLAGIMPAHVPSTGGYGARTTNAVRELERRARLPVDGVLDPRAQDALGRAVKAAGW